MKKLVIPKGVTVFVTGTVNVLDGKIDMIDMINCGNIYAYQKPDSEHLLIDTKELNIEYLQCNGILYCGEEFSLGDLSKFEVNK